MRSKIIRLLYYILFLCTPLLVYSKTSELFEFNKMIVIYVIALLSLLVWSVDVILFDKPIVKSRWFFIPVGIFLGSQVLSTIFSIDIITSLYGYYGRFNGGLFSILAYLTLFYVFLQYYSHDFLKRVTHLSLLSSLIVLLWGIPGKFGYDLSCLVFTGKLTNSCWTDQFRPAERMFSTLGQPNWLGSYLSVNFFIGLYFFFSSFQKHKPSRATFLYFGYLLLNVAGILFTRSDSAYIATAVGAIIFFTANLRLNFVPLKALTRYGMYFGIVTILLVLIFKTGIGVVDKYITLSTYTQKKVASASSPASQSKYSITNITDSWDIRKIVWEGAVDVGKSYPVLGTGVETFAHSYYFARPIEHNLTSEWDFLYNKAHNEYLNYFATTGVVGTLAYLGFIIATLWLFILALKKLPSEQLFITALLSSYVSILITNFFGFSITVINIYFYLIPAFIFALLYVKKTEAVEQVLVKNRKTIALAVGVFLIIGVSLLHVVRYYIADTKYALSDQYYRAGEYQQAATLVNDALKLHYSPVYQDKISYILANISYFAAYQDEQEAATSLINLSNAYNARTLKVSSKNVAYWKTKSKNQYLFYQATLNREYLLEGIRALEVAARLAPTDPKIPYSLSLYHSLLDDDEKNMEKKKEHQSTSLTYINKTIELKPNYEDAYFLKGQLLKKYGSIKEAREVFEFILKEINPQNDKAKGELEM